MGNRLGLISAIALALALTSAACGNKNVAHIGFNKTGHSLLAGGLKSDTSAQGGSSNGFSALPGSTNTQMPRTSLGGTYQRASSQSTHYRIVGGFHVTQGQ